MTQSHLLIGAASFTRKGRPWHNTAVVVGALIPDAALYGLFVWSRLSGVSMEEIFRERYWSPAWQAAMSPGNSAPLFLLVLLLGYLLWRSEHRLSDLGIVVMAFAGAALAHIALDFPLHVDDGHTHLWPFTNWKYESPVSYWDPNHFGNWVRPVEFAIGIACLVILIRRFPAKWVRAGLLVALASYIIEPLVFFLLF